MKMTWMMASNDRGSPIFRLNHQFGRYVAHGFWKFMICWLDGRVVGYNIAVGWFANTTGGHRQPSFLSKIIDNNLVIQNMELY